MLGDSVSVYLDGGEAGSPYERVEGRDSSSTIVDATALAAGAGAVAHPASRRDLDRAAPRGRRRRARGAGRPPVGRPAVTLLLALALISAVDHLRDVAGRLQAGLSYRLYPKIRDRDVHTRPTPRLGGIAMFLGILVAFAVAWLLSSQFGVLSLIFSDSGPILAILGRLPAHRRHRRGRRHLGPGLDDQARRSVRRGRPRGLARRADLLAADRRAHRRLRR